MVSKDGGISSVAREVGGEVLSFAGKGFGEGSSQKTACELKKVRAQKKNSIVLNFIFKSP